MDCDPTHDEMRKHLEPIAKTYDADKFDIEEAIYWFANDFHSGQCSNLYSVLSMSDYKPSPIMSGCPEDGISILLYQELEAEFCQLG